MSALLTDGLYLMVLGMGVVFVFLTLLVIATHLMSFMIRAVSMAEPELAQGGPIAANARQQELVAVAAAAMAAHQQQP